MPIPTTNIPTTMNELQQNIRNLGAKIRTAATTLAEAAGNPVIAMSEITRQQDALKEMNDRMAAMQAAYDAQYAGQSGTLPTAHTPAETHTLRDMLKSNEYARAFASALRTGERPTRMTNEKHKVLYDALTIAGGDPAGEDGGFLVPDDIDHSIMERRRALHPLADIFNVETTSANAGWRVMDKSPTTGMTALTSEIPSGEIAQDDQPEFAKVTFALTTYGMILPVSAELAADEVANLFGYLAKWFAKKQVITENLLLKGKLEALTAANLGTTDTLGDIKKVLNVTLDPDISLNARLMMNQDAYNYLDSLKDTTGRPLLMPDPTNATGTMFKGRPVLTVSNSMLPTRTVTTTGNTKGDYYPIYLGDFTQYATLFQRQGLEIASTDIGGNAFRTNSIEVRGISRMGASTFDMDAAARREIFIAASAT